MSEVDGGVGMAGEHNSTSEGVAEPAARRDRWAGLGTQTLVGVVAGVVAGVVTSLLLWLTPVVRETWLSEPSCDDPDDLVIATPIAVEASGHMQSDPMAVDAEHGHPAGDAIDGDAGTAWAEGADGTGRGEWIEVALEPGTDLRMICIVNGYAKTYALYRENSRARQLEVATAQGTRVSVLGDAGAGSFQRFRRLGVVPGSTDHVTLTIRTTWSGAGDEGAYDTSISELEFWRAG
ncbi:hypothetical protein ACFWGP_07395 [Agromyces sp. NPDC127015]|uniref:NADase-type glycan-binding domain-containing protein n=1 Tax=Agromyces sp. NPDC127015 TaxID=3347108 RepID=UPI00365E12E3